MTDSDLAKFIEAQDLVRTQVTTELRAGHKLTHWIWFVFPQLEGLGHSGMSKRFGIRDLEQARRYLADPVLGARLRVDLGTMLTHDGKSAREILGSPDDMKLRSCITLFELAATDDEDLELFRRALEAFFDGRRDELTTDFLSR